MFKISANHSLSYEKDWIYHDIAYDGSKTYLSTNDKQVIMLDESYTCIKSISTEYSYYTLCYDNTNNCFWAASFDSPGILFRLSHNLDIEANIELSLQGDNTAEIDCLFYDSMSKRLLAAKGNNIYSIGLNGKLFTFYEIKDLQEVPFSICILSDRFLCLTLFQQKLQLKQFSRANGRLLSEEVLPIGTHVRAMAVTHHVLSHAEFTLLLLEDNEDSEPCIAELKQESVETTAQPLNKNYMRCPLFAMPADTSTENRPDSSNYNCCMGDCSGCGNSNCDTSCSSACDSGCNSNCNCPICHHHACTQVIESIALTETSIAHILNAEGEKLQKAIACCTNVNELLKVNDSVLRTIIHSTQLEQMLFYKLEAALRGEDCCCQPCMPPCRPTCHAQSTDTPPDDTTKNIS